MTTLGIAGAGQLGRMMTLAAAPLGIRTVMLDPSRDACGQRFGDHLVADFDDLEAMASLAQQVDVATFEFENIPPESVAKLAEQVPVHPPAEALATARDRWAEKSLFRDLDIPLPPVARIDSQEDLDQAVREIGLPAVLKTRTLGYDGKGQKVLRDQDDVAGAHAELGALPCVLEGFVNFSQEVSCLGVRTAKGQMRFYDLVVNEHDAGILFRSQPAPGHRLQSLAEDYTGRVMEHLNYVGVMAFEFFCVEGQLLANEIAPRVHNSGHWTIEGARTSQFENHVRAVCGLPLGSTETREAVVMLNVYGERPNVTELLSIPGAAWHDYEKVPRPGRKIGHITLHAADMRRLQGIEQAARACLRNQRS
ncbi:MAG: 5-(carboxyamino)imidazole ribonucleotide synthase [Natronospirillum sp.]|uniref:5-(carboxyamino)imidazole ribonucleotide synthase n=1 Tax=Natronospirillum sp. TaxID=2812955 RepID=UPI0025D36E7C|nr:5-(carboxyamino)imidazole ribonucleotide synthase [Natronospirillum sp.]MCH8552202.1 5-(carboxyamino)imidazole ribonucleotide synthase [Natronospirillum sp.]